MTRSNDVKWWLICRRRVPSTSKPQLLQQQQKLETVGFNVYVPHNAPYEMPFRQPASLSNLAFTFVSLSSFSARFSGGLTVSSAYVSAKAKGVRQTDTIEWRSRIKCDAAVDSVTVFTTSFSRTMSDQSTSEYVESGTGVQRLFAGHR